MPKKLHRHWLRGRENHRLRWRLRHESIQEKCQRDTEDHQNQLEYNYDASTSFTLNPMDRSNAQHITEEVDQIKDNCVIMRSRKQMLMESRYSAEVKCVKRVYYLLYRT